MKTRKSIAFLLTAVMAAAALAGCNSSETGSSSEPAGNTSAESSDADSAETGEISTITWYLPLDVTYSTEVQNAVLEEVNNCLADVGVYVDFHIFDSGTYTTRLNTMLTAGDDMDVFMTSSMYGTNYTNAVALDACQDISQYLDEYAAEAQAALPEILWDAVNINGSVYGFPAYKDNAFVDAFIYNKTMADDLGIDVESYLNEDGSHDSYWDLVPLFYDVKEKRDAKYPDQANIPVSKYGVLGLYQESFSTGISVNIPNIESYSGMGSGEIVFCQYMTPEYLEACQRKRQLVVDGILPGEANYDSDNALQNSGMIFGTGCQGLVNIPTDYYSDEFDVIGSVNNNIYLTTDGALTGVYAVSSSCEDPIAAVKALNMIYTDNHIANTLHFGIEGEDYVLTDDNRVSFEGTRNADSTARSWYYWYGWQWGNMYAMSLPEEQVGTLWDDLQNVNETATASDNLGFVFDTKGLENEIAAVSAVCTEYVSQMENGFMDNLDQLQQDFIAKLEASGIQTVIDACQEQLNTWRAEQGLTVAE